MIVATAGVLAACGEKTEQVHSGPAHYQNVVLRDMTGDGVPDTLTFEATGNRADSMIYAFTIRSAGRVVYDENWPNTSEIRDGYPAPASPSPSQTKESATTLVKRRVASFFDAAMFRAYAPSPADTAKTPGAYVCAMGNVSGCIGADLQYANAAAARKRQSRHDTLPPNPNDVTAFLDTLTRTPFDTAYMKRIVAGFRADLPVVFTCRLSNEEPVGLAWSRVAKRFFIIFVGE